MEKIVPVNALQFSESHVGAHIPHYSLKLVPEPAFYYPNYFPIVKQKLTLQYLRKARQTTLPLIAHHNMNRKNNWQVNSSLQDYILTSK